MAFFFFVFEIYALIVSKLFMPYTGHVVIDWIKDDEYYCVLIPILIPVTVVFMYLNWLSMKFFKHA